MQNTEIQRPEDIPRDSQQTPAHAKEACHMQTNSFEKPTLLILKSMIYVLPGCIVNDQTALFIAKSMIYVLHAC